MADKTLNIRNSVVDWEIMEGLTILDKYKELNACIKANGNKVYVGKTEKTVEIKDFKSLTDLGFGVDSALVTDPVDNEKYYCYVTYLNNLREAWQFQTKY